MAEEETTATEEGAAIGGAADESTATGGDTSNGDSPIGDAGASGDAATGDAATGEGAATGDGDGGDKGGDDAGDGAGASEVPETYADFKLPEGMELSEDYLNKMTPVFKELGLTQDGAQKLIDINAEQVQAGEEARANAFTQLTKDWIEQARNDKEIGGEKFDENIATARHAVAEFGSDGLNELLRDYGIGNHPEVIRAFTKIGALLKEDRPGTGSASNSTPDRAEQLYGTTD